MASQNRKAAHRLQSDSDLANEVYDSLLPKMASANFVINRLGLVRVAGNMYECPSTKDFWQVKEGKIMRLTSTNEVDNSESLVAADSTDPEASLKQILADLEFYD
jgi:hypothetical protein